MKTRKDGKGAEKNAAEAARGGGPGGIPFPPGGSPGLLPSSFSVLLVVLLAPAFPAAPLLASAAFTDSAPHAGAIAGPSAAAPPSSTHPAGVAPSCAGVAVPDSPGPLEAASPSTAALPTGENPSGKISPEYKIKAACLYKFADFVSWPAKTFVAKKSPILIGILGKDPFGPFLDKIVRGEKAQGRFFAVERFPSFKKIAKATKSPPEEVPAPPSGLAALGRCHILFIASSEKENLEEILKSIEGLPVLTVSDMKGFASRGGVIGFVIEKKRVRFEINVDRAAKAGLKISSKLLRLAKIIGKGKEGK